VYALLSVVLSASCTVSLNHCPRCDELGLCLSSLLIICALRDSIDHASKYGVSYIAQPGGSIADDEVGVWLVCRCWLLALLYRRVQ
jgi:hypothetical protein